MKKFLSVILTAGIIFTGICGFSVARAASVLTDFVSLESEKGSEYGYADYKFVDDFGDEVNASNPQGFVPDSSQAMTFALI